MVIIDEMLAAIETVAVKRANGERPDRGGLYTLEITADQWRNVQTSTTFLIAMQGRVDWSFGPWKYSPSQNQDGDMEYAVVAPLPMFGICFRVRYGP